MKDLNSYKELIYLMIDGEAGEVERETLFSAMHDSSALQSEFQNALNINNAAKSYAASEDVPPALTEKLFNKAGLTYTAPVNTVAAANAAFVSAGAASSGFWNKLKSFASGKYGFGFAGLILGGILMILITDDSGNSIDSIISVDRNKNISSQNNQDVDHISSLPMVSSDELASESNDIATDTQSYAIPAKEDINKQQRRTQNNAVDNNSISEKYVERQFPAKVSTVDNNTFASQNKYPGIKNFGNAQYSGINSPVIAELISNAPGEKSGFGIEVNSSFYWNMPKETVSPEEIAKLHNMNLFLYYELNEDISVGAGVRQETFYAKYRTSDELNRNFIYEQQPNLTNFELSLRYHPLSFGNIYPFLNLNAGGGEFGYTYRAGAGCELKYFEDLSFLVQFEYAGLRYNHMSNWYNSKKIGFNYGIKYNF